MPRPPFPEPNTIAERRRIGFQSTSRPLVAHRPVGPATRAPCGSRPGNRCCAPRYPSQRYRKGISDSRSAAPPERGYICWTAAGSEGFAAVIDPEFEWHVHARKLAFDLCPIATEVMDTVFRCLDDLINAAQSVDRVVTVLGRQTWTKSKKDHGKGDRLKDGRIVVVERAVDEHRAFEHRPSALGRNGIVSETASLANASVTTVDIEFRAA